MIRPLLESVRKQVKLRTVDLYEVFFGVLYLLKSACQWQTLPSEYPKRRTADAYFTKWSEPGADGKSVMEHAFKKCGWRGLHKTGAQILDELFIVNAHSVKNTDTAGDKGYDAGKKVPGIKRHIAVDIEGLPHAIAVTTAEVTDHKGALLAPERCADDLQSVSSAFSDGGYQGKPFADAFQQRLGAEVLIAKRTERHTFAVMPKRWIVMRSFAWLDKCRGLRNNCERKLNSSLQPFISPFLSFCSEDREQALRVSIQSNSI